MAKRPAPRTQTLAGGNEPLWTAELVVSVTAVLAGFATCVYIAAAHSANPEKGEPVKYFQELVDLMAHDPKVYAFFTPHGLAVEVVGSAGRVGKTFTLTEIETSALNPITEALPRLRAEANDEVSE